MKKPAIILAVITSAAMFAYSIFLHFRTSSIISSGDRRYSQASIDQLDKVTDLYLTVGIIGAIVCFLIIRGKSTKLINSGLLVALGILPIVFYGFNQALFVLPLGIAGALLFFSKEKATTES